MRRLALAAIVVLLAAGGGEEQQQKGFAPEQAVAPNAPEAPTVIVLEGGSSLGDWAAILTGAAALIAALGGAEAFRRRRRDRAPERSPRKK